MQTPYATAVTRFSTAALLGIGALAATGCNSGTPVAAAPSTAITAAAAAPASRRSRSTAARASRR